MTPQHMISQLLESDSKNLKNILLLKKIILTTYLGRLQINGQSPDNSIALGNYLFDHEHVLFDFTRLSDQKKHAFQKWLLEDHQQEKTNSNFRNFAVNEYRGFTAEVHLSWWGKLKRWLQKEYTEHWKINDIDLSLNYQLLALNISHGQQGILVGFDQLLVPPSGTKYKAADDIQPEPLGNTKRVFVTDKLVELLAKLNLDSLKFETMCKGSHPLSINVDDLEARHKEMLDYRQMQKYVATESWYVRLWQWLRSFFTSIGEPVKVKPVKRVAKELTLLYANDTTSIYQRSNQQILVKEKRPNIENLVYCGGGAKIFAHIGVWKALNELNIAPKKFAGSSAGAIMALMCYLGYSSQEIAEFFKYMKKEHLIYFDLNRKGISEPHALKTAIDYVIAQKVQQIVTQYNLSYPHGAITFATLDLLRKKCPGCGLGEELIVTATNKRLRQTKYFSFNKSPHIEISEAVKVSASLPVIFRDTQIDGDDHNDGGVLNNFPTDAFSLDNSTFLESEYGNNMKTLAVQFDNGTERAAVDGVEQVYRENFILNWIYGFLTGVSDPASGWEQDRMKLRKYAGQSIIIDVGNTSTTSFSVEEKTQADLIKSGYQAAKNYFSARYARKTGSAYTNKEIMHSTFVSIEELLAYSCYRGDRTWFERVVGLIKESSFVNKEELLKQAARLKSLYFPSVHPQEFTADKDSATFFGNHLMSEQFLTENKSLEHRTLLALYPIFIKLTSQFICKENEHDLLERARHAFTPKTPFNCLAYFELIKGETHVVFHIFHNYIKELRSLYLIMNNENVSTELNKIYEQLKLLHEVIYNQHDLLNSQYYASWDLTVRQGTRILKALKNSDSNVFELCGALKRRAEPMIDLNKHSKFDCEEPQNLSSLHLSPA